MKWVSRLLGLWAAYTVGHWVGWGRGRTESRTDHDDVWSEFLKENW